MKPISEPSFERAAMPRAEAAACISRVSLFRPSEIIGGMDGEPCQMSLRPHCGTNAMTGINRPIDSA